MLTIYVNKSIEMGSSMFSLKKISYIVYFIAIVSIFRVVILWRILLCHK